MDAGFSVYAMNGEAFLGGVTNGGQFWDGVLLRSKVLLHFASHSLFVLSDPIGNPNLTGFSILLASSTLPFDLCPLLHQNSQKHNQLEKPSIS